MSDDHSSVGWAQWQQSPTSWKEPKASALEDLAKAVKMIKDLEDIKAACLKYEEEVGKTSLAMAEYYNQLLDKTDAAKTHDSPDWVLRKALPGLNKKILCPVQCGRLYTVGYQVIHLNDYHEWTREQIADWLDTLDIDLSFPTTDTERE